MRIIDTIPHSEMRISIFQMNNKYILKLEWGPLEQSYKWDEYDFTDLADFKNKVQGAALIENSLNRFKEMRADLAIND